MATSAMKIQPGTLSLHTYNTYRDMMTIQAPSKKPICQRYQRGECSGKCPYFHPASLPPQSAPLKTTPTTSKQPKSTPNPTKPPTQPTPSTSTPTSPQPPKKEEKSVSIPVVPGRQGQKVSSTSSRPAKPQTSQVPVPPTHPSRQSRSSTLVSGSQTEAQMFNSDDSRVKGTPSSVSLRPQNVVSSSVAISAVTPRSVEPAPMQETPSSPSTSGTSPSRKNGGRGKKKPEKSENSTTEVHLSRESVSPEQFSIPESSLAQRDQKDTVPPRWEICRKYLHKLPCSQNPCPYYHDPELADFPPLCLKLYDGPCNRRFCEYYHPQNNRYRRVCSLAVNSRCERRPCAGFHFRLPTRQEVDPVKRSVSPPPQNVVSCSVAISAITPPSGGLAPKQEPPSSPSSSGTSSPRRNGGYGKKKFENSDNPRTGAPPSPQSVSPEQVSIQELSHVQCDQKAIIPMRQGICRNYLHKRCSQNPCLYYHDPSLADCPPLCDRLVYEGRCTKGVCEYYHPENNRNRTVCRKALASQCERQHCPYFHFRLPREEANKSLPSTSPAQVSDAGPSQSQCPAWNDGYCPERTQCKMLHLSRVTRWKMEAEQAAAKTMDRMIFDNTKVVFGAGCEIKEVTTALESCRVLISNLPARTTKGELEAFLTSAGFNRDAFHILILRKSMDRETQEASVIFNDARHAETVVEVLDKQKYFDEVLKFELAPIVTHNQMDDWTYNRSSYLEVFFLAPSMRVQAIYPSVEVAIEKAKALNGAYCGGRIAHVTLARRPEGNESWTFIKNSIIISNIATTTSDPEILRFANPFSIRTFAHRRYYVPAVLQGLKEHMQTIGDLKPDDFDVIKNYQKGTILVRARFDAWEKADKVYQWLQDTELDFLAPTHARFFLAFPYQYSLHIPPEHYDAQKEIYDGLESQYGRERTAHIVATRYMHPPVCLIQVVGIDKKAVGALKLKVEKIARGEVVEVWDRFFVNWQGVAFFGRLLRQFGAYVRPDRTRQVLRVYGSEAAVNRARREIKEQMKTLAALDFQVNIEDHLVGFFIHRGMKILGDTLGEDNVWLHTTSKPYFVSVRGGHDAEHALRNLLGEAKKRPLRPTMLNRSQSCPLCFEEPAESFPLVCQHVYCTGCLKHTLNSAIDGRSIPIRCIGDGGRCQTPIPLPVIERFISPALLTQTFENSFRVYLEQRPNEFRFCSTPDCTQIYRVSKEDSVVIQCPACLVETCSHCHRSPHRGLTCEENALVGSKSGQELLLERWAKGNANVKRCPDCGVLIEKVDGCNHIHCRCGGHVCWICVKTFNDGIYDHLNAVHGGAYDADH